MARTNKSNPKASSLSDGNNNGVVEQESIDNKSSGSKKSKSDVIRRVGNSVNTNPPPSKKNNLNEVPRKRKATSGSSSLTGTTATTTTTAETATTTTTTRTTTTATTRTVTESSFSESVGTTSKGDGRMTDSRKKAASGSLDSVEQGSMAKPNNDIAPYTTTSAAIAVNSNLISNSNNHNNTNGAEPALNSEDVNKCNDKAPAEQPGDPLWKSSSYLAHRRLQLAQIRQVRAAVQNWMQQSLVMTLDQERREYAEMLRDANSRKRSMSPMMSSHTFSSSNLLSQTNTKLKRGNTRRLSGTKSTLPQHLTIQPPDSLPSIASAPGGRSPGIKKTTTQANNGKAIQATSPTAASNALKKHKAATTTTMSTTSTTINSLKRPPSEGGYSPRPPPPLPLLPTHPPRPPVRLAEAEALRQRQTQIFEQLIALKRQTAPPVVPSKPSKTSTATSAAEQCQQELYLQKVRQAPPRPQRLPPRRKTQWDFVMDEMVLLSTDYIEERKWKIASARLISRAVSSARRQRLRASSTTSSQSVSSETESLDCGSKTVAQQLSRGVFDYWTALRLKGPMVEEATLLRHRLRAIKIENDEHGHHGHHDKDEINTDDKTDILNTIPPHKKDSAILLTHDERTHKLSSATTTASEISAKVVRLRKSELIKIQSSWDTADFVTAQLQAIRFFELLWPNNYGGILQGIGKTYLLASLAWREREKGPQLVICSPIHVMRWSLELAKFAQLEVFHFGHVSARLQTPSCLKSGQVLVCETAELFNASPLLNSTPWTMVVWDTRLVDSMSMVKAHWLRPISRLCGRKIIIQSSSSMHHNLTVDTLARFLAWILPTVFSSATQVIKWAKRQVKPDLDVLLETIRHLTFEMPIDNSDDEDHPLEALLSTSTAELDDEDSTESPSLWLHGKCIRKCTMSESQKLVYKHTCLAGRGALSQSTDKHLRNSIQVLSQLRQVCMNAPLPNNLSNLLVTHPNVELARKMATSSCKLLELLRILVKDANIASTCHVENNTIIKLPFNRANNNNNDNNTKLSLKTENTPLERTTRASGRLAKNAENQNKSEQLYSKKPLKVLVLASLPQAVKLIHSFLTSCGILHDYLESPPASTATHTPWWLRIQNSLMAFDKIDGPNVLVASPDLLTPWAGGLCPSVANIIVVVDDDWSGQGNLRLERLLQKCALRKEEETQLIHLVTAQTCEETFYTGILPPLLNQKPDIKEEDEYSDEKKETETDTDAELSFLDKDAFLMRERSLLIDNKIVINTCELGRITGASVTLEQARVPSTAKQEPYLVLGRRICKWRQHSLSRVLQVESLPISAVTRKEPLFFPSSTLENSGPSEMDYKFVEQLRLAELRHSLCLSALEKPICLGRTDATFWPVRVFCSETGKDLESLATPENEASNDTLMLPTGHSNGTGTVVQKAQHEIEVRQQAEALLYYSRIHEAKLGFAENIEPSQTSSNQLVLANAFCASHNDNLRSVLEEPLIYGPPSPPIASFNVLRSEQDDEQQQPHRAHDGVLLGDQYDPNPVHNSPHHDTIPIDDSEITDDMKLDMDIDLIPDLDADMLHGGVNDDLEPFALIDHNDEESLPPPMPVSASGHIQFVEHTPNSHVLSIVPLETKDDDIARPMCKQDFVNTVLDYPLMGEADDHNPANIAYSKAPIVIVRDWTLVEPGAFRRRAGEDSSDDGSALDSVLLHVHKPTDKFSVTRRYSSKKLKRNPSFDDPASVPTSAIPSWDPLGPPQNEKKDPTDLYECIDERVQKAFAMYGFYYHAKNESRFKSESKNVDFGPFGTGFVVADTMGPSNVSLVRSGLGIHLPLGVTLKPNMESSKLDPSDQVLWTRHDDAIIIGTMLR